MRIHAHFSRVLMFTKTCASSHMRQRDFRQHPRRKEEAKAAEKAQQEFVNDSAKAGEINCHLCILSFLNHDAIRAIFAKR
jgi:hypothetical protein